MQPGFSIIIPARNEARLLPRCIASLRHAQSAVNKPVEIIVVCNRCTDSTEEIARTLGATVIYNESKNLAAIRNAGVHSAHHEIVITVDADSIVSANMLSEVDRALSSPHCIGGGVLILPERWSFGIAFTIALLLPFALFWRISGGLFFCRRCDFEAVGGFNERFVSVEDIEFARRLRAFGKPRGQLFRTLFRAHIVTSCRKFDHFGDWYFIRHPFHALALLRGKNVRLANKLWYDFPR